MMYAYSERFVLPLRHDEVVHGKGSLLRKMPGDRWQQLANLRSLLAYMWAHPGKQLLFMGCEIGQESEWAESRELDWWLLDHPEHLGVKRLVSDLNRVYTRDAGAVGRRLLPRRVPVDRCQRLVEQHLLVRTPRPARSLLACIVNFSGVPHLNYRIGLPEPGRWDEVLNTDAVHYAGSGVGNLGSVSAAEGDSHGMPAHATITVPPLGAIWLRHVGGAPTADQPDD